MRNNTEQLRKFADLKRAARKSAKQLRGQPRGCAERQAAALELRDWRAKYEKERFRLTGVKRNRVAGY